MRMTVIASHGSPHQIRHQEVMCEGLRALGHEPIPMHHGTPSTEAVACWGWRKGAQLRELGHSILVLERGYLGDRFSWTSLAWNGLNGRGTFALAPDDGGARFREHFGPLVPWRTNNYEGYVLIVGQVPGDASLQGRDLEPWYADMADRALKLGFEPVFRQHPVAAKAGLRQGPRGIRKDTGSLAEALAGAAQVVTYNSNTGVDAAVAGVPVYVDNEGSMAWPVGGQLVGDTEHAPDREAWAQKLAWRQWRLEEIASGEALKGLL